MFFFHDIANEESPTVLLEKKDNKEQTYNKTDTEAKEKLEKALAKPVPQDLKSLPEWLINKVRKQEVGRKDVAENSAKVLKRRMLSTLPQISDQLQSLVIVTKKSIFPKAEALRRLAVRAPIKGKLGHEVEIGL